ncbi:fibronectin type III domain protein [Bacteroides fragilis str. S36L5]|uniref:Fibronectin type III domain protein n=1 Tax=Bacteroides fragilis str. S36L11 TaxID=1339327 RepID=A0A015X810_BACFG|nr:fibronectin type III domain-containing protein [Bacteroides fragilis]EXZ27828.1 fibronectin type III domain protein [Bacteroides fragilis str. S36L11]EYA84461.1 fibronectin type III domain protein [Bacteroides fragilis str. S36L12]EYA90091.1 fibronectin type III domain protein [Bacteroides fragilis str. S36L5]
MARETRNYDYSFLEVEVTDLLPNTHYYIRPYVTTEEGTGYGPVVEFTTEPGTEPIIDYFTMYIDTDRSVNLYATFYIDNYQITHYGYSYGIYSPETGTVTDEQKIEVPLEDNHGQQLSKVITGLRPGILYAFRVYAENGVGVTYSGYQTVKIPVE